MSEISKFDNVKKQYSNDKNLSIRTNLHIKYSTNTQGFVPWLFEQYNFAANFAILELGCGNGGLWEGRIESMPLGSNLVLSDFSNGMVKIVEKKYRIYNNVSAKQINIEDIPYQGRKFDVIIANHMLYHVPNLTKALSEVSRILKKDGKFYCTTNGKDGMTAYLKHAIRRINPNSTSFTQEIPFNLENGQGILERHFDSVKRLDYEDSLRITNTQDLIEWIKSTLSITSHNDIDIAELYHYFENIRKSKGVIEIPKECGLFTCMKPFYKTANV